PRAREGEELADPEQREVAMPQGGEGDGDAARERQSHGRQATGADTLEPLSPGLTAIPPIAIVPSRSGRMRVRAKDCVHPADRDHCTAVSVLAGLRTAG